MALPPGPYSGTSSLSLVARVSAFSYGLIYDSIKLKALKKFTVVLSHQDMRRSLTRKLNPLPKGMPEKTILFSSSDESS